MSLLTLPLLRSVIRFSTESETNLAANLQHLRNEIEPSGVDKSILAFISDIYDKTQEVPSYELVRRNFADNDDGSSVACTARLESLRSISVDALLSGADGIRSLSDSTEVEILPFIQGNEFRYELDQFKLSVAREATSSMLLEASTILTAGIRGRNNTEIKGVDAALDHLQSKITALGVTLKKGSIEGSFRRDGQIVRRQYETWKNSPQDTVGVLTGIDKIDAIHRGAKNGDLALVLGFVSHLKTSFCLNWLYNTAILFGRNSAIVSLETPVKTLRTLFYVMHSAHPKFKDAGYNVLDHEKVTTASLTPDEEKFFELVINDFENCEEYGHIYYKEPNESTTVPDIQRWAEGKHKTTPVDLLVVDYLGLVDPEKGHSSMDSNANLNKVIRQAKVMAMTFAQGRGIPVVSPHQANRSGLAEAEKNAGKYKINALANTNEAERSADLIYFTYLDDILRNSRELLMGNLKARNCPLIQETFKVYADASTRVISNLDLTTGPQELVTI